MLTVAQCANPYCLADFLRLSDGTLYQCPPEQVEGDRRLRCAWLCEVCSKTHMLEWRDGTPHLSTVRRWPYKAAAVG